MKIPKMISPECLSGVPSRKFCHNISYANFMGVNFMAINFARISLISFAANIFSPEELKRSIKQSSKIVFEAENNSGRLCKECLLVRNFVHIFVRINFEGMIVTNISDFRANIRKYIDTVINDNGSLVINRGNTAAVLISLEEYNSIKETERILASDKQKSHLFSSIAEMNDGDPIEVNIEDL
ncbi:MAG: type II toxin-antitoxin system Phd/YefM family antitoxin [Candidatus Cryptobacteroides sp.]